MPLFHATWRRCLFVLFIILAGAPALADLHVYRWMDRPGATYKTIKSIYWVDSRKDPAIEAVRVSLAMKDAAPGDRVIGVFYPWPPFDKTDLPRLVAMGPHLSGEWYRVFFWRLHLLNATPDRIVLDYESDISVWQTVWGNPKAAAAVAADSACAARLGKTVMSFPPQAWAHDFQAASAWDQWAAGQVQDAIARAVLEPAQRAFTRPVPVTNYGDVHPKWPIREINNWRLYPQAVSAESSPPLYIVESPAIANRYKKDPSWNAFLNSLNTARSCAQNGPVVPWVSNPSYRGDEVKPANSRWLWEQQIRHLHAMGVRDLLYFNAFGDGEDDVNAERLFTQLAALPEPTAERKAALIAKLDPVDWDADSVTTGGVTTTYDQFQRIAAAAPAPPTAAPAPSAPAPPGERRPIPAPAGVGAAPG